MIGNIVQGNIGIEFFHPFVLAGQFPRFVVVSSFKTDLTFLYDPAVNNWWFGLLSIFLSRPFRELVPYRSDNCLDNLALFLQGIEDQNQP
ncbi:MAG: hypothetical protein IPN18_18440 [Ignavibacteriales bacterium]|nr:hypothetical protein [Ignavibacteriales bacterium]